MKEEWWKYIDAIQLINYIINKKKRKKLKH